MKKFLAVLCAMAIAFGLAACASNPAENSNPQGEQSSAAGNSSDEKDTLVFISHMTSETLDPYSTVSSGFDKNVMYQIFDCLLQFDDEGNVIPCLAESWEETEDGKAVVFKLREDVTFHDGTPFNADAVVYSIDLFLSNPLNSYALMYFTDCEKVDEYSVKITKGTPTAKLYNYLAEYIYIVSPTAYEKGAEEFAKNPVGTGAYKFESQGADQYVRLGANEDYFGGAPYFKKVIIRTPLDSSSAIVALQTGEADIAINVTPNQLSLVENDPNLTAVVNTGWSIKYLSFFAEPFLSDENLRKAVYYGVNRENAALFNNEPETTPATQLFPERLLGKEYSGLVTVPGYDFDLAKEYLEKSSYDGETLYIYISANEASIATSVLADLQALGISAEIVQLDMNAYYDKPLDGDCQITIGDYGTDVTSTEDMLGYWSNVLGFYGGSIVCTDEYDALITQISEEYDAAARKELVKQAMEMQVEFCNLVPLYESYFNYIHRSDLTGFNPISGATYVYYLGKITPVQ